MVQVDVDTYKSIAALYVIFSALSFFSYMAFLSEKTFQLTCMHLYTKVGEKIRGGGVYIA